VRARFSAHFQTGPGAHPASCTMGTGSFSGVKSGRGVTLSPHPLLVPWSRTGRAIPLLPYGPYGLYRASVPVQGWPLPLHIPVITLTMSDDQMRAVSLWNNICPRSNGLAARLVLVKFLNTFKWKLNWCLGAARTFDVTTVPKRLAFSC